MKTMLLPRLSTLLCLAGLTAVPAVNAYEGDESVKSIPVCTLTIKYIATC
jgi:mannose-binding lectin 2